MQNLSNIRAVNYIIICDAASCYHKFHFVSVPDIILPVFNNPLAAGPVFTLCVRVRELGTCRNINCWHCNFRGHFYGRLRGNSIQCSLMANIGCILSKWRRIKAPTVIVMKFCNDVYSIINVICHQTGLGSFCNLKMAAV